MRRPRQRSRLVELVGEDRHHIVGVDGRAEPDPGAVALAVEVGGHHEVLGASGSVSGSHAPDPDRSWNCPARRRAGEPVGEREQQRRT